jgi:hypothetical protein
VPNHHGSPTVAQQLDRLPGVLVNSREIWPMLMFVSPRGYYTGQRLHARRWSRKLAPSVGRAATRNRIVIDMRIFKVFHDP